MQEPTDTIASRLVKAYYRLKQDGAEPTRLDIKRRALDQLVEELHATSKEPFDKTKWNPKVGEECGKFMDIPVYNWDGVTQRNPNGSVLVDMDAIFILTGARKNAY